MIMSSVDSTVSFQSPSNIHTNQFTQPYPTNKRKFLIQIGIIAAIIVLVLVIIILTFVYLFTKKSNTQSLCAVDVKLTTLIPTETRPITSHQLTTKTDREESRNVIINPCIEENIQYEKWGIPIQNYSLYSFDASVLVLNALISLYININSPNIGCTWSLDVFPMDNRTIEFSGRPTDSVFGLYDQVENSIVQMTNVSTIDYWTNGTGKFRIGITGAWYGTADIGCQGYGIMKICFSHP